MPQGNFNSVMLIGNIVRKPELKYTDYGSTYTVFDIAVSGGYMDFKTKHWKSDTLFIPVQVFGKQAEQLVFDADKGSHIFVSGKLRLNRWHKKDGMKATRIEVKAETIFTFKDQEPFTNEETPADNTIPHDQLGDLVQESAEAME
jgi:single-strand DNA-binding protein